MTRDEQLAWLQHQADDGDEEAPAPDHLTAAAMRIVDHRHGWWYNPPLSPETVLTMAELAQLPPWHVRDDSGKVWKLRARGNGIERREYRLVAADDA